MQTRQKSLDAQIRTTIAAGEEVISRIRSALNLLGPRQQSIPFYTRSRVKSFESIAEKILRKRKDRDKNYELSSITDICGFRIVTLYDAQLIPALELVFALISTLQRVTEQPLFVGNTPWDPVTEAKFYLRKEKREKETNDHAQDIYLKCHNWARDLVEQQFKDEPELRGYHLKKLAAVDPEERRYSSIHFIVNAKSYNFPAITVPVEIQVRTASEDIWAEIDHHHIYKIRHPYLWDENLEGIYDELRLDSRALKEKIEVLPSTIQRISDHYEKAKHSLERLKKQNSRCYFSVPLVFVEMLAQDHIDPKLSDLLDEYRDLWLPECHAKDNPKLFDDAEKCVDSIRTMLAHKLKGSKVHKSTPEVIRNLLAFEDIRLKALRLRQRGLEKSDAEVKRGLMSLFEALEKLNNDQSWKLKPNTVLQFWRAFLLEDYDSARARDMLLHAYDGMQTDESLAVRSIYRILIPRRIARLDILSAKLLWQTHDNGDATLRSGTIFEDVKRHAFSALRFGKEALEQSLVENEHRGDLLFGFGETEKLWDLAAILLTLSWFGGLVSIDEIREEGGIDHEFVKKMASMVIRRKDKDLASIFNSEDFKKICGRYHISEEDPCAE